MLPIGIYDIMLFGIHVLNTLQYIIHTFCYSSRIRNSYTCAHIEGLSDVPGESMVKLYCPKCCDVYTPKSSRHHHIDGVYFGTGFPHMLFMVHPELRPPKPTNMFVPR